MKARDLSRVEGLLLMCKEKSQKIELGLGFIKKIPKKEQFEELNALERETKELQNQILQIQKLKTGLTNNDQETIRVINEIELMEDKEVELHVKFQSVRKSILGLADSAVGGEGGGGGKGALMAAALGMKIGEQGIKKTEEILATLKEANNLMDNMQGDIMEQRKKLHRIKDKVKQGQSIANRGREALKYFSDQASKDVCIKVMVGLIVVMVLIIGGLTYQISQERDAIQISPEEGAEENLGEMGLIIDANGKVKFDPVKKKEEERLEKELEAKRKKKNKKIQENYDSEVLDNKKGKDKSKEKDDKEESSEKSKSEDKLRAKIRKLRSEEDRKVLKY